MLESKQFQERYSIVPLILPREVAEDAELLREFLGPDYEKVAKQRYLETSTVRAQVLIAEGKYYMEYFHTFGSNDKVSLKNGQLVTSKSDPVEVFIKRHQAIGGISAYETIQIVSNKKFVKATYNGNSLVDTDSEATFFQVLGVGSHYVFQYFNPLDPTTSYQLGVENKKIGTAFYLAKSKTELFKLIPVPA